jgi:hypothetical protein
MHSGRSVSHRELPRCPLLESHRRGEPGSVRSRERSVSSGVEIISGPSCVFDAQRSQDKRFRRLDPPCLSNEGTPTVLEQRGRRGLSTRDSGVLRLVVARSWRWRAVTFRGDLAPMTAAPLGLRCVSADGSSHREIPRSRAWHSRRCTEGAALDSYRSSKRYVWLSRIEMASPWYLAKDPNQDLGAELAKTRHRWSFFSWPSGRRARRGRAGSYRDSRRPP